MKPLFVLLAGPNGSGKSTLAATPEFQALNVEMLNPDEIAKTSPSDVNALIWAGRKIHHQIENRISEMTSFAIETTLSGNNHFKTIERCKSAGYYFAFHFIFVRSVTTSMGRVQTRVAAGGHDVPEVDQQRRFQRSIENSARVVNIADESHFYYNGTELKHKRVAQFLLGKQTFMSQDAPNWLKSFAAQS